MVQDGNRFHHPYQPYAIQADFMSALYDTLDSKKIGIFESPTGTGKTLSLICGSMTWLRDQRNKLFEGAIEDDDSDDPQWVKVHAKEMRKQEYETRMKQFEEHLEQIRNIEEEEYKQQLKMSDRKRKKIAEELDSDDRFLLVDYDKYDESTGISASVQKLLDQVNGPPEDSFSFEGPRVKIFFTSRTHSQLSQFVGQLKLPQFPGIGHNSESTKLISLGSRRQLCIHPKVSKHKSVSLLNEACMELQKSTNGCEFLKREHDAQERLLLHKMRDRALAHIRDIEDLADLGNTMAVCPYYGSRAAIPTAEIVSLPYQLLMQKSSRDSLGIDLADSVVIIDEAHNLLDTISSLNSCSVSVSEVLSAKEGLEIYWRKFSKRLKISNRLYLSQTLNAVTALHGFLSGAQQKTAKKETAPGREVQPESIFAGNSADLVNMYQLERFLRESKLAFKVDSYLQSETKKMMADNNNSSGQQTTRTPLVLTKVAGFLQALCNPSSEGKIFYARSESKELQLQYLLLDPSEQFRDVVDQARCVILAGGTMEPVADYLNYLFPYVDKDQIHLFNCGHVIPDENLSVSAVSKYGQQEFLFTFANRQSREMVGALGNTIIELADTIPKGLVVFLPSYQYLSDLKQMWKAANIWGALGDRKKIFLEPRDSTSVEVMLNEYSQEIESSKNGAVMFCVVGGKMSEGINFSDNLARGVVMVGLPFPNAFSAEMVAKREYLENAVIKAGGTTENAKEAARDYYENLCMRAVNQCIGRAIRHANDYAAVVLVDSRYDTERIQRKLPAWIRKRMAKQPERYNDVFNKLKAFYLRKVK
jgi:chromosome transmission fidelity protein 1